MQSIGGGNLRSYLKMLRQEKGMSQLEVAKELGISESYYNLIENGKRQNDMPISRALKLANLFGITSDNLFELEERINTTD